jgi:hypothetical protein
MPGCGRPLIGLFWPRDRRFAVYVSISGELGFRASHFWSVGAPFHGWQGEELTALGVLAAAGEAVVDGGRKVSQFGEARPVCPPGNVP